MHKNRQKRQMFEGDSDSDTGQGQQLKINENYAQRYDTWRGNEELQKLKDRHGDNPEEDESSSSSSEEEWTSDKEEDFFKTFALLKKKDPKIYDSKVYFFQDTEADNVTASSSSAVETKKKNRNSRDEKITLKDHERKMILEKGTLESESEDDDAGDKISKKMKKASEPTYVQEQEKIKKGFSEALKNIESGDESGDDYQKSDLLKRRKKTEQEEKDEKEDYRMWLKGEVNKLSKGETSAELKFLKEYWNNPNLNEGEKFLRDYILNRRYQEQDDSSRIPSYDEIVHDSDEAGLSGDEEQLKQMEEFEHKYNFRFEEPDQEFIKRYPRTVESSLRRAESKRKLQRDQKKERKDAEKDKKREEIQRLKALKRKEILEKLKKIEQITGDENLAFRDEDIEGDFDPTAHDRRMQQIFNEQYYKVEDDEQKPEFPYDEELDAEDWAPFCPTDEEEEASDDTQKASSSSKSAKKRKANNSEPSSSGSTKVSKIEKPSSSNATSTKTSVINELIEASKGKRQNKKKSSIFLQALERNKPKFESTTHKSFQEYFDEYYQLDFEDLIGDLPCRFKYRNVTPNDFGLTMDEVLRAPDRELNQWASLKKTYQYRSAEEETYELDAYKKKAANEKLKKKVLPTIFAPVNEDEDSGGEDEKDDTTKTTEENGDKKKRKRKKKKNKKKKNKSTVSTEGVEAEPIQTEETTDTSAKNKNIVDNESNENSSIPVSLEDSSNNSLESPKKKKKNKKKSQITSQQEEVPAAAEGQELLTVKKQKNKTQEEEPVVNTKDPERGHETNSKKGKKRKFDQDSSSSFPGRAADTKNNNKKRNKKDDIGIDDDRLKAYGINPTKYKKQLKYGTNKK